MKKQNKNDNAANRKSYVGHVFNIGEKREKEVVLNRLNPEWARLHREGYIHIHDLDAYGLTYNCLTFDILNAFPYKKFEGLEPEEKIVGVFDFLKELIAKIGNEQSGGMSFANFDMDISTIFKNMGIIFYEYDALFRACIRSMILWCNNIHTRMGQTSYYVTFCLGLGTNQFARYLTETLISCFYSAGDLIYKPNIVFKVHEGINRFPGDPNFDLLEKALFCTAKKMIPTYLLCDCEADRKTDPTKLSIMGCRTRVVDDLFGKEGAIGRSNIDNISINLPRLAFEVNRELNDAPLGDKIKAFEGKWKYVAKLTKDILLDRYEKTCEADIDLFPTIREYKLTCEDINQVGLRENFKHGTLSLGFIGLSEAMEALSGVKYWHSDEVYKYALNFVKYMRIYVDELKKEYNLNFSLLATSGEYISGRFEEIDSKLFDSPIIGKGYYTNSFHIDVDSGLPAYKKLELEGPFHLFANGGCISYIELSEAPIGNAEGLDELMEVAIKAGVHYLGFNFPKDVCKQCGASGTFDICPECGSKEITRIRRVSGYLEIQDYFTKGKMHESKNRRTN